jgi:hypothetical protein
MAPLPSNAQPIVTVFACSGDAELAAATAVATTATATSTSASFLARIITPSI